MERIKNGRIVATHPGKTAGRFWLMAGATLLTWQINNQVVQADAAAPVDQPVSVNADQSGATENETGSTVLKSAKSAENSAAPKQVSQASLVAMIGQAVSQVTPPQNSDAGSAGSAAKSEQSAAPSQTKNVQSIGGQSETAAATPSSAVQQPENSVATSGEVNAKQKAQPTYNRLRMAAPAVPTATVNDHTSGTLGTSKWSIDTTTNTLTIGPGELADTGVKVDADGNTDWGLLDWNNYKVGDTHPKLTLKLDGPVVVGKDASYLFSGLKIDRSILTDGKTIDTKKTTNMTGMFSNVSTSFPTDSLAVNLDTGNVTTMAHMFDGLMYSSSSSLTSPLKFSSFETSNVTDMSYMFANIRANTVIDLSNFNTSKVTSMAHMFEKGNGLTGVKLSSFKTDNVKDMSYMFAGNSDMTELDLSNFDTSKVESMAGMFYNTSDLGDVNISSFDTKSVTDMAYMFSATQFPLDLSTIKKFDTSNVVTMERMFSGKKSTLKGIEKLKTDSVTDMSYMFYGTDLAEADFSHFDTSSATNMTAMFEKTKKFSGKFLTNFDTGKVTNMQSMFSNAGLEKLDFTIATKFNTENVQNMSNMFADNAQLKSLNVSNFDTANVVDMSGMFMNDSALTELNVLNFDTSNVTNMSDMFMNDDSLTGLDLSKFDTSNVTDMSKMFINDGALTRLDLRNFKTPNLTSVWGMFAGDGALQYLNLAAFDTRNVKNQAYQIGNIKIKMYGLFNLSPLIAGAYDVTTTTNPKVLILGANVRLKMDWPMDQVNDVIELNPEDNSTLTSVISELLGYGSVDEMKASLFTAGLLPANTKSQQWVHADTGEQLTAQDLMNYYGHESNTAGTWTWQIIAGKDYNLIAHPTATWTPTDNFDHATDDNDQSIDFTKFAVTIKDQQTNGEVDHPDTTKAGKYDITYHYKDTDGITRTSAPVTLTIAANQDAINVKDIVLQLNDSLQAKDYLVAVINADGTAVDFNKVTTSDTVNSQIPGKYTVTYQFTDMFDDVFEKTVTVIVNGLTLKQAEVEVSTDDQWDPQTNVVAAVDDAGQTVAPEKLTITMTNDTGQSVTNLKRPGTYHVSYSFVDGHGTHTQVATVTVVAGVNHADLQLKSNQVTLYEHDMWSPLSNINSLIDADGTTISAENWAQVLHVDDSVNTAQAGTYNVTYKFVDLFGQTHTATTVVLVKASQAGLAVKKDAVQLYTGDSWKTNDNLASVTDVDGSAVDFNRVIITSNVDLTKPGQYLVTYRFTDRQNKVHAATTVVTVLKNQSSLTLKQTAIRLIVGETWQADDNLASVTDIDGSAVDFNQVIITDNVDLTKPGQYLVTYRFTDRQNKSHAATTTVTVLANQASLVLKQSTVQLTVGGAWNALENVVQATDVDGTAISADQLQIDNPIILNQAGTYLVTYQFTDQLGVVHTAQAQVTFKNKEQPGGGGQTPEPKPTPENPKRPATPTTPDNQPSAESSKQQPTEGASETDGIKTHPVRLQSQTQSVQPAQSAIKLGKSLPQTDEQPNKQFSIMGLIALALSSLGLSWLVKGAGNQRKRTK